MPNTQGGNVTGLKLQESGSKAYTFSATGVKHLIFLRLLLIMIINVLP